MSGHRRSSGQHAKARVAVATVSGKAYYLIVSELKRKNIPFMSITPYEHVPIEIQVVITTVEENRFVDHERTLTYRNGADPTPLVNEALQIVQGKESFERVIIGVDPGDVFGLAVLAGGKVIETENCYSLEETTHRIATIVRNLENIPVSSIQIRIGNGVRECEEKLMHILDNALPPKVILESVSEIGTNRSLSEAKHRRGLRDIVSAIQIAGRTGQIFHRRSASESNS